MEKTVVLVIDDEQAYINFIVELLGNEKYKIIQANNGKIGLAVAQKFIPNIIISDWEMPEMSGIELTKQLQLNELTRNIPVIISTGIRINSDDLSLALNSGAVDFLQKPVNETELLARVGSALRLANAYSKIKNQNDELQKQLTNKIVQIQQFTELKTLLIKNIEKLRNIQEIKDISDISQITNHINELLQSKIYEINWGEFDTHFEIVYQGFLSRLKLQFPELSSHDLRLCAFIKLKMSSKEISQITYTSPDSVDTARKRLKKKLGLSAEENLQTYIIDY